MTKKTLSIKRVGSLVTLILGVIIGVFVLRFSLYLFTDSIKTAYFNQQLKKANYCSSVSDCELVPSHTSGSCSLFINSLEIPKLIALHKRLNLTVSFVDCLPTEPQAICQQNKCTSVRL